MIKEIKNVQDLLRMRKEALHLHEASNISSVSVSPDTLPAALTVSTIEEGEFTPKNEKVSKPVLTEAIGRVSFFERDLVRYPLIFLVSFGFFYFVLNFGAFSNKLAAYFSKEQPQSQTEGKVLGVATPDYNSWISKYFYQTNNADALSPNNDYDQDGLTNYQEFLLGTNPTKKDTDNDGYSDGQEILNGYNPLYEGKLTGQQQDIIKDWNLQDISDRISYFSRLAFSSSNPWLNPLGDLPQGPADPASAGGPAISYDLNTPGEISIPKINVKAPIVWSQSPDNFAKDLENGPIHYPGTPLPGQNGVSYISAHSSNYVWSKSKYSFIFSRIDELSAGDEFFVTVNKTDGQPLTLRYIVTGKKEYKPDDQAQFEGSGSESTVNLSTCWPLGSTARRFIVSGKMTGV